MLQALSVAGTDKNKENQDDTQPKEYPDESFFKGVFDRLSNGKKGHQNKSK